MLRNIYLYGDLKEKFGKIWELDVASVGEAIRAINALTNGKFIPFLNPKSHYKVVRGEDLQGESLDDDTVKMNFEKGDFHLSPVPEGAGGWGKIVLGAVLIAVGVIANIYFPGNPISPYLISMGAGMMIGGVMQLLTPVPKVPDYGTREKPEERPSFIFDGPTNTIEQGGSIPLVYGRIRIGSTVISSALDVEDVI